jgi:hypothetical protein
MSETKTSKNVNVEKRKQFLWPTCYDFWGVWLYVETRSRIHESTISLRFLAIILIVLKLEVFHIQCLHYKPVSNATFARGGGRGGDKVIHRGDCE